MIQTIILAIVTSSALSALISGCFTMAAARKKTESGISAGVRMLLYDRVKHLGEKYRADGEISGDKLEDLIRMHKIYHDELNGNGYLDSVMEAVRALPIK